MTIRLSIEVHRGMPAPDECVTAMGLLCFACGLVGLGLPIALQAPSTVGCIPPLTLNTTQNQDEVFCIVKREIRQGWFQDEAEEPATLLARNPSTKSVK